MKARKGEDRFKQAGTGHKGIIPVLHYKTAIFLFLEKQINKNQTKQQQQKGVIHAQNRAKQNPSMDRDRLTESYH